MGAKATPEDLEEAIKQYLKGGKSVIELSQWLGIDRNNLYHWIKRYQEEGIEGLRERKGVRYIKENSRYTPEEKVRAVEAYQNGEGSLKTICKRYGIRSDYQLRNWIKVYNSGRDFKKRSGGSRMRNPRKTTQEERIQIARECLESGKDYGGIAQKHQVSYQQVYTWVKKFEEMGEAGLEDRRGQRTRQQEPRTPEEEMKARIAQLEHELYMTRMERDLLKKVKELERRDRWGK